MLYHSMSEAFLGRAEASLGRWEASLGHWEASLGQGEAHFPVFHSASEGGARRSRRASHTSKDKLDCMVVHCIFSYLIFHNFHIVFCFLNIFIFYFVLNIIILIFFISIFILFFMHRFFHISFNQRIIIFRCFFCNFLCRSINISLFFITYPSSLFSPFPPLWFLRMEKPKEKPNRQVGYKKRGDIRTFFIKPSWYSFLSFYQHTHLCCYVFWDMIQDHTRCWVLTLNLSWNTMSDRHSELSAQNFLSTCGHCSTNLSALITKSYTSVFLITHPVQCKVRAHPKGRHQLCVTFVPNWSSPIWSRRRRRLLMR